MSENKKMVEAITPINEDFAQWYTDICLKAELVDYSGRERLRDFAPVWLCHLGKHHAPFGQALQRDRPRKCGHAAVHT